MLRRLHAGPLDCWRCCSGRCSADGAASAGAGSEWALLGLREPPLIPSPRLTLPASLLPVPVHQAYVNELAGILVESENPSADATQVC